MRALFSSARLKRSACPPRCMPAFGNVRQVKGFRFARWRQRCWPQRFNYQQVLAMVNFENQSLKQLSIEEAAEEVALAEPEAGAEGTD